MSYTVDDLKKLMKTYLDTPVTGQCLYGNWAHFGMGCNCGVEDIIDEFLEWIKYREAPGQHE